MSHFENVASIRTISDSINSAFRLRNSSPNPIGFSLLTLAICVLLLSGCGKSSESVRVIKLAHALDPVHPVHVAMVFLADRVYEKSGGQMRIDVYHSQQLGSERELLELLQIGSLGIAKTTTAVLEGFSPRYQVYGMPYIFRDREHFFKVLEGEIGRQLLLECEDFWLRGLCYYDSGSRSFYTKDAPIHHPDDLKGMKIRTPESPTAIKLVNALGGSSTPISYGELYTALQQGVVDGAENNPPTLLTSRQYEVISYYSLDEHTSVPDILAISTHVWRKLNSQERSWLQEAADESYEYQKTLFQEAIEESLKKLEEAGVEIVYPDKRLFREKVEGFYDDYKSQPEVYSLIKAIRAVE